MLVVFHLTECLEMNIRWVHWWKWLAWISEGIWVSVFWDNNFRSIPNICLMVVSSVSSWNGIDLLLIAMRVIEEGTHLLGYRFSTFVRCSIVLSVPKVGGTQKRRCWSHVVVSQMYMNSKLSTLMTRFYTLNMVIHRMWYESDLTKVVLSIYLPITSNIWQASAVKGWSMFPFLLYHKT